MTLKTILQKAFKLRREVETQYERDMTKGVQFGQSPAASEFVAPDGFPISAIDLSLLKLVSPNATQSWVEPIKRACREHDINTIRRVAAFITTLAHEGGFKVGGRENMNYSAKRLRQVWPSRFSGAAGRAKAEALHRKPVAIANEVYANRMGNGTPQSGDGWRFRGNGAIQLTGRANHAEFGKSIGKTAEQAASYIENSIEGSVAAAAWFWTRNGINRLADTPSVIDETKKINGGVIGIKDRRAKFDRLVAELLRRERLG
jgi:putative chitinase